MIFKDEKIKQTFFEILKHEANFPCCVNCGKLFDLAFPNTEVGLSDNLICHANDLICTCENMKKVEELYKNKKNVSVDVSEWYKPVL